MYDNKNVSKGTRIVGKEIRIPTINSQNNEIKVCELKI